MICLIINIYKICFKIKIIYLKYINKMKVYIIGYKGWIASMFIRELNKNNIEYTYSNYRAESEEIKEDILKSKATHILCSMGRTHGTYNGKKYTTIDYLENKSTLKINLNDNLYSPLSLALFCDKNNLHFTYIGTGCIFEYNNDYTMKNNVGFTEESKPNFFGSSYSLVKGFTDMLIKNTNALTLRIRMPITSDNHHRNFITKITTYEKICNMPNSMSVLDNLIPIAIKMMQHNETGTYNFTNPGSISHNEILVMYKEIVDNNFKWKNFTVEEQDKILLGKRSNNLLNTSKLESLDYVKNDLLPIYLAVRNCLNNWKIL